MSDRELLELAAKAAGIEWYGYFGDDTCECQYLDIGPNDVVPWNPLADDGDAMRLAVKCGISPTWYDRSNYACAEAVPPSGLVIRIHEFGDNPGDCTRRAIVRAAAEIGRAMP